MDRNHGVKVGHDITVKLNDGKTISVISDDLDCEIIFTIHEAKLLRMALLSALRHAGHELPQEPTDD